MVFQYKHISLQFIMQYLSLCPSMKQL
jgi:hypothetical protein